MDKPICPLCGNYAEATLVANPETENLRAVTRFNCRTCGTYGISFLQREAVRAGYKTNRDDRVRLSAATRNASELGEWIELTSETIPLILARAPNPDPVEAVGLVLEYLARHYTPGGRAVPLEFRHDYPLIYAKDEQGLIYVVKSMSGDSLIERADKSDHPQFRVTMAGYERLKQIRAARQQVAATVEWPRVARTLGEIRKRQEEAKTEEQYQAVGLLCREALISAAQAVYDAAKHPSVDGTLPSSTDSKRMLEAVIQAELGGEEWDQEFRAAARATVNLAVKLQHMRTATYVAASMCTEATESLIRQIQLLIRQRPTR